MKVLVVGSGGREHAIVWKLVTSSAVDMVYCAPGNGGTALIAQNVGMPVATETDCDRLAEWAYNNKMDLVIVGPEVPLAHGMVDTLLMYGVPVAGPTRNAAQLEWSKAWAKEFIQKHGIPTPDFAVLTGLADIRNYLREPGVGYPLVIKADSLAAGKGAFVVKDMEEAEEALIRMQSAGVMQQGQAAKVVIEEFLEGFEVSAIAFADGRSVLMMPPACDYKRLLDDDTGPLTGGMGAYSPTGKVSPELWAQIEQDIMLKTVQGMLADGIPYRGFLYAGIMLTEKGPKVLEFNCRLGDPEAQVLLPRLKTPLENIALAMANGSLSEIGQVEWSEQAAVGVVVASEGYPISGSAGKKVAGLSDLEEGVLVFHAGTELRGAVSLDPTPTPGPAESQGSMLKGLFGRKGQQTTSNLRTDFLSPKLNTAGGRLLTVVALGDSIGEARAKVYRNVPRVKISGVQYRSDIAAREE